MSNLTDVSVVSPIAMLDYAVPERRWRGGRGIPRRGAAGGISIEYPRWLYPPFGGVLNAFCLFARLLWPVLRLRRKHQFDLLSANFAHPEGIATALLAAILKVPFIVSIRGNELYHRRFRFRRYWMAWALRRAQRVIAVSDELGNLAISFGAHPSRVVTILNGTNSDVFFPRDRAECRRIHRLPPGAKVILSVGYLAELKGHHRIIQALSELHQQGVSPLLVIAGGQGRSGEYGDQIRKQIADCQLEDNVRFTGEVPQSTLAELMSAADVLCLASSREGCPNVVNEALACGTPVVATDVGAVRQMIPSPEWGLVVPPNDVAALRDGLALGLDLPWNRLRIAQQGQARSWRQVAREVLSEMELAASEHGSWRQHE